MSERTSRIEERLAADGLDEVGPGRSDIAAMALSALAAASGECRMNEPYAELRPVLTRDGLLWCCNHEDEHCSQAVG